MWLGVRQEHQWANVHKSAEHIWGLLEHQKEQITHQSTIRRKVQPERGYFPTRVGFFRDEMRKSLKMARFNKNMGLQCASRTEKETENPVWTVMFQPPFFGGKLALKLRGVEKTFFQRLFDPSNNNPGEWWGRLAKRSPLDQAAGCLLWMWTLSLKEGELKNLRLGHTWGIIPFSKWLRVCKPFETRSTLLRGLTKHA